jgi:hypothetical protein
MTLSSLSSHLPSASFGPVARHRVIVRFKYKSVEPIIVRSLDTFDLEHAQQISAATSGGYKAQNQRFQVVLKGHQSAK